MSSSRTIVLEIPSELNRVFPLVRARNPHLDVAEFSRLVLLAQAADGYRLIARESEGRIKAVMGYRILHDLTHGSHLHIDDLAFEAPADSTDHLGVLLQFAESEARRLGLNGLRMASDSQDGRLFFESEGWDCRAATYRKPVANH